jgi:transcriptional regulator with XRE-family HTH domain
VTGRRVPKRAPKRPRICRAIRAQLDESDLSMQDLADRLRVSKSMVQRWTTTREPALEMIVAIEDALDLVRGELLRDAGYVSDLVSVRRAVLDDPKLDDRARRTLLALYRQLTG